MALPTVLEKLQVKNERNFLIQGLPSAIEKPFAKLNYAKSVTPLLKTKKIDFALIFALNIRQLTQIIDEVNSALHDDVNFWVAYPKSTSKIYCDLTRDYNWDALINLGYEAIDHACIDNVWTAIRFSKNGPLPVLETLVEEYSLSS